MLFCIVFVLLHRVCVLVSFNCSTAFVRVCVCSRECICVNVMHDDKNEEASIKHIIIIMFTVYTFGDLL